MISRNHAISDRLPDLWSIVWFLTILPYWNIVDLGKQKLKTAVELNIKIIWIQYVNPKYICEMYLEVPHQNLTILFVVVDDGWRNGLRLAIAADNHQTDCSQSYIH